MIYIFNLNEIHSSWKPFFKEERIQEIYNIEQLIKNNYNPAPNNVFRFAAIDLSKVKCIWLGQDAYPAEPIYNSKNNELIYVATGRSFEVGTLNSWLEKYKQTSLKNILRLIYKAYNSNLISYSEIKSKIENNEFKILPPNKLFDNLEKQGVLFLNTYLTCEINNPNSHREYWQNFSNDLINYISITNPNIIWFLWGAEAQKNEKYIIKGKIYKSNHPRLYNTNSAVDFLNSNCFYETKDIIDWCGKE